MVSALLALGVLVVTMLQSSSSAEPSSPLQCKVTRQPDGLILYELSRPTHSGCRDTCWEGHNRTVLARDSEKDRNLVRTLTNQSITLNVCQDSLHYERNCNSKVEKAHCSVNCSLLIEEDPQAPPEPGNTTLICFSETMCVTQEKFGLCVLGVLLAAAVLVGLYFRSKSCRCRRAVSGTVSYSPAAAAAEPIKIEPTDSVCVVMMQHSSD